MSVRGGRAGLLPVTAHRLHDAAGASQAAPRNGIPREATPEDGTDPRRPDLDADGLPALLAAFYDAVGHDSLLAPHFAALDITAHLPRIADFWATVLFHADRYRGNAFRPHLEMPGLTPAHFARWVATLEATVDAHHAGPAAEQMKALAHRIAYSMQLRLGLPPFAAYAPRATSVTADGAAPPPDAT